MFVIYLILLFGSSYNTAVAAGSADIVRGEESELMLVPGSENGHVEEAAEYRFFLYRHWSLYDAMFHSPYVASKLSVWNHQGTAKLQVRACVDVVLRLLSGILWTVINYNQCSFHLLSAKKLC